MVLPNFENLEKYKQITAANGQTWSHSGLVDSPLLSKRGLCFRAAE